SAQYQRLQTSTQGRNILRSLHFDISNMPDIPPLEPPWDSVPRIEIRPIPKSMHRIENKARREHRTFHLSHNTTTTYYYTDASYNNETKLGNTAVVGPEFKKAHHHSNAPTSTSLEIQAIAEAIQQHNGTDNITIRTDSQSAIRHFRQNTLPVHIRAVLVKH
ncbi:uncharacterized protein LOC115311387, partial [Ixodes scapularis]|uniref:uncharacterized protein LOC115311387 n=1 Tax=Ixodes scapularis TaxID=6945 RepID=UPI001A9E16B8